MAQYTVKQGDTLYDIAKNHGTTYQEIAKANGISNPNLIYAGQTLNIGGNTTETPAASSGTTATTTGTAGGTPAATAPTFNYTQSDAANQSWADYEQLGTQKPGEYNRTWLDTLGDTINQIMNREKFSYDLNGDMLYQQYKDQYTTQGKMAMMDTMGQAQAMTGGYGNSYAQSVGQQAYQGYLQQLNDKIPELYQLALNQYNQEGQDLYEKAGLLYQMDEQEYGRNQDEWDRYYKERNDLFEKAKYMSETEYKKALDDFNIKYTSYRDTVSDDQWNEKFAYQKDQDALTESWRQKEFDLAMDQWNWEKEQAAAGGSGGGGGDTGDGGTSAGVLWYNTGTYDENGNLIFRNSEGKTQAFGPGINPYTGTKHPDAKNGTFSNGYQPNNIGGTPLEKTEYSTGIYGKEQTIWTANGKYWLWNGSKNKYEEVDLSDLGITPKQNLAGYKSGGADSKNQFHTLN